MARHRPHARAVAAPPPGAVAELIARIEDGDAEETEDDGRSAGLVALLEPHHDGDLHAIASRLAEIAAFLPCAIGKTTGGLRAALESLAAVI